MAIANIDSREKNAHKCCSERIKVKSKKSASLRKIDNNPLVSDLHAHDVILGRGEGVNKHYGNILFRKLVAPLRTKFHDREEKKQAAMQIIDGIKQLNPPGRFLMISPVDKSSLYEISDKKAVTKVYQSLRDQRPERKQALLNDDESLAKDYDCLERVIHNTNVALQERQRKENKTPTASQCKNTMEKHVILPISYIGQSFAENPAINSDESKSIFRTLATLPHQSDNRLLHLTGIVGRLCQRIEELENRR